MILLEGSEGIIARSANYLQQVFLMKRRYRWTAAIHFARARSLSQRELAKRSGVTNSNDLR